MGTRSSTPRPVPYVHHSPPPNLVYTRDPNIIVPDKVVIYTRTALEEMRNRQREEKLTPSSIRMRVDKHATFFSEMVLYANKHDETEYTHFFVEEDAETVAKTMQKLQSIFVDTEFEIEIKTSPLSKGQIPVLTAKW